MAKKANKSTGKSVATALLELLGVAIEEGVIQASDVAALVGEDEPKTKSKSKSKAKDEEEEEEEEEIPDFDDMSEKEMKKFCKDNEIEIPKKVKGEDALREFLEEQFASDDDEEEEEEEESEDDTPDFDDMDLKEMKKFVKDNELKVPAKVLKDEDDLREWLEENFSSDEEEEEEDEEEDDTPDFDDMDLKEMKKFCKENDLEPSAKVLKDEEKLREWLEENFSSDEEEEEEEEEDDEEDEGEWEED